jgi:tight adherence protein B
VPILDRALSRLHPVRKLDQLLQQANVQYPLGFFLLLSITLSSIGFFVCSFTTRNVALSIAVAAVLGSLPLCYVRFKKKQRMKKFETQLPYGLDIISRALKAGYSLSSGMKLAADECEDPLSSEFDQTLDEINAGVSVPDALENLVHRVDCPDLRYFAVSAIIQRESGGNLAEILDNIAHVVRERFRFRGKVRILSAEGRLSAIVLTALPLLVVITLLFINPDYIRTLVTEPAGRAMAAVAGLMMIVGVLVMKKMVNIKL